MELNPDIPIILVDVDLYGLTDHRRVQMVLDTGTTYTLISWEILESLGYDPSMSTRRVNLATAGSLEQAPVVTIAGIRALDVEALNVDVVGFDMPAPARIRGLLGLSFLKHFDIDLHFLRRTLTARNA